MSAALSQPHRASIFSCLPVRPLLFGHDLSESAILQPFHVLASRRQWLQSLPCAEADVELLERLILFDFLEFTSENWWSSVCFLAAPLNCFCSQPFHFLLLSFLSFKFIYEFLFKCWTQNGLSGTSLATKFDFIQLTFQHLDCLFEWSAAQLQVCDCGQWISRRSAGCLHGCPQSLVLNLQLVLHWNRTVTKLFDGHENCQQNMQFDD